MNVIGYTKTGEIRVIFEGDDHESFVSDDMGNRHRQMIAEWESRGNVIPPYLVELNALKATLRTKIDDDAEAARLRYITGGAGQAMTYQRKVEEAKQAILEEDPEAGDYPMLAASLGIDGVTVKAVAALVLQMDALWAVTGSAIERLRQTAKEAVSRAETAEAAQIAAKVVWP